MEDWRSREELEEGLVRTRGDVQPLVLTGDEGADGGGLARQDAYVKGESEAQQDEPECRARKNCY